MKITENPTFKQLYITIEGIEYLIPSQYRADFLADVGVTDQQLPLNNWHSPNTQTALEQYGERITAKQITIL